MISTFFLTIFYSLVSLLVGFLPSGVLPSQITSAFAYFIGIANSFSYVIPMDTLLQVVVLALAYDGVLFIWWFINWIIRKIPGMQ